MSIWTENVPNCGKAEADATLNVVELALRAAVAIEVLGGDTERFVRMAPRPTRYPATTDQPLGNVGAGDDCNEPDTRPVSTAPLKFVPEMLAPVNVAPLRFVFERLRPERLRFRRSAPGPIRTPPTIFQSVLGNVLWAFVVSDVPVIPVVVVPVRFAPEILTPERLAFFKLALERLTFVRFTFVRSAFVRFAPERFSPVRSVPVSLIPVRFAFWPRNHPDCWLHPVGSVLAVPRSPPVMSPAGDVDEKFALETFA